MAKIYYNPDEDELIPIETSAPKRQKRSIRESSGFATFIKCVGIVLVTIAFLAALAGCCYGMLCFLFRWQFWIFIVLALAAIFLYKLAIVKLTDPDFIIYSI